jgi:hypothetical protein
VTPEELELSMQFHPLICNVTVDLCHFWLLLGRHLQPSLFDHLVFQVTESNY